MRLSDLHTGERGVIVKVTGHGGFRKRIVEMGFIKGKVVDVLQNAPLQDPVKYKIMGYEVSLRHSEASMIEVCWPEESKIEQNDEYPDQLSCDTSYIGKQWTDNRHSINVALVGNPNCGKTSLFNYASGAHERVGNYSGVTVDAKEAVAEFEGYTFNLVDLPGTYSLSAYSPEELYVRKQIIEQVPDVIINVIDSSNLERNLYLTTQLIDMHLRMVCALNMFDEFEERGDKLDVDTLGQLMGVPMVPCAFKEGKGVKELFHTIIQIYENREGTIDNYRHIHINHGHEIEEGISHIQEYLKKVPNVREKYSTRFLAIKLLERDKDIKDYVSQLPHAEEIFYESVVADKRVREEMHEDTETAIMDAKYGFIRGALKEANHITGKKKDTYKTTHKFDRLLTNRIIGFPLFVLILFLMFHATFTIGQYPMDWIEMGVEFCSSVISSVMPDGILKDMLIDGVIGGVGSVIVFLPQILILYTFISFMEDSGYMSRAAFIMDKLMHMMGLHGKSFIPLIMGFGCNVPAIMACRTIESRRSRLVTMLILPLMSCSARLPIYIMIVGTFFAAQYRSLVLISLYVIGIFLSILMSRLFCRFVVKGEDTPFVMELPPYRFPTAKAIGRHTWEKGKQYLKKMGGVILVASIIVWALGYFPHHEELSTRQQQEQSYIGQIGKVVEPIFEPQGFNWKLDVGLVSGVGAKEIVASSLGVLYADDNSFADDDSFNNDNTTKYTRLRTQMENDGLTPLSAVCFLLFVLIYFPCIASITAIKSETGKWKWAVFAAGYTTILAWIVSAAVYQIGLLLGF